MTFRQIQQDIDYHMGRLTAKVHFAICVGITNFEKLLGLLFIALVYMLGDLVEVEIAYSERLAAAVACVKSTTCPCSSLSARVKFSGQYAGQSCRG